jgi:hypothetical protein
VLSFGLPSRLQALSKHVPMWVERSYDVAVSGHRKFDLVFLDDVVDDCDVLRIL